MVLRHLLDSARRTFRVAAAEQDHQDLTQRAELVFAAAGAALVHVHEVLDSVERFVWSHPELTVLRASRHTIDFDA